MKDLTGMTFGSLTVMNLAKKENNQLYWECKCDCGNTTIVRANNLKSGGTRSCGCMKKGRKPKLQPQPVMVCEENRKDCGKTDVFFSEWDRMCKMFSYNVEKRVCNKNCPLYILKTEKNKKYCNTLVKDFPTESIDAVQRWSDVTPVKTRLTYLMQLPITPKLDESGLPQTCAGLLFGFQCNPNDHDCTECWNAPMIY